MTDVQFCEPSPFFDTDRSGPESEGAVVGGSSTSTDTAAAPHKVAKEFLQFAELSTGAGGAGHRGLSELRDQYGINEISLQSLKTIRRIGEGAFANVELAAYTPPATSDLSAPPSTRHSWVETTNPAVRNPSIMARDSEAASALAASDLIPAQKPVSMTVAVKRLKPGVVVSSPEDLEAFVQEVALMRKLKHSHIVRYIGIGAADQSSEKAKQESMFLVQEYVGGGNVKKLVMSQMTQPHSRLYTHADALRWVIGIADALAYMHSVNPVIIHRDLKLENILLTEGKRSASEAKLADFGLVAVVRQGATRRRVMQVCSRNDRPAEGEHAPACQLPDSAHVSPAELSTRASGQQRLLNGSHAGSLTPRSPRSPNDQQSITQHELSGRTGTLTYMAPEMFRMEKYNEKVDVFSFAVVMYELFHKYMVIFGACMSGTEEEVEAYALRVSKGFRPPLKEKLPVEIRALISDCWAQEPSARPSMQQVVQRLRDIQASGVMDAVDAAASAGCGCTIC